MKSYFVEDVYDNKKDYYKTQVNNYIMILPQTCAPNFCLVRGSLHNLICCLCLVHECLG